MKSLLAAALRLILPLLLRRATVDFFRTDEDADLVEREEDRVEADFGLAEVLLGLFVDDEDRVDERDDDRPFCAISPAGRRSVNANKAREMRRSITTSLLSRTLIRWDYREFMVATQDKQRREKSR